MLCLLGLLLSCGALCLTSPVPPATAGCTASSLILETLSDVQTLKFKGRSKITSLNMMEEGGSVTTYLDKFIEVLKSSEEMSKERMIAQKLQKIKDDGKSCRRWMEHDWEPAEEKDFFVLKLFDISPGFDFQGDFHRPIHVKNKSCAHDTTEIFISGLKNITAFKCIQTVETNMETLENKCSILKNSSSKDQRCSKTAKTSFLRFKESLEEFLRWVNENKDCGNIRRSESGLYPDGICSCPDPWKAGGGLF